MSAKARLLFSLNTEHIFVILENHVRLLEQYQWSQNYNHALKITFEISALPNTAVEERSVFIY